MKKFKFAKHIVAVLLAAAMILSLVPASIMAGDGSVDDLTVLDPDTSEEDEEETGIVDDDTLPEEESYTVNLTLSSNYENAAVTVTVNGNEQTVSADSETDLEEGISWYCSTELTVEAGDTLCVTAEADTDNSYHVSKFTVNNEEHTEVTGENESSCTWSVTVSETTDYEIYFEYEPDVYNITLSASEGGSASLADSDGNEISQAYADETYILTVKADEGYQIGTISVGGTEQEVTDISEMEITDLSFSNDSTVAVTFMKVYTVTILYESKAGTVTVKDSSEDGQEIASKDAEAETEAGTVSFVRTGSGIYISAQPSENYRVSDVLIQKGDEEAYTPDDISGENDSGYSITIDDIDNDYEITITFALNQFELESVIELSSSSDEDGGEDGEAEEEETYGTISFSPEAVSYGSSVTVTITPVSGKYVIKSVAVYTADQLAALESTEDAVSGGDETADGVSGEETEESAGGETEEAESSDAITLTPSADGESYSFTITSVTEALTVYVTYAEASAASADSSYFTTNAVRINGSAYIFTKNDDGTEDDVEPDTEDSLTEGDSSGDEDSDEASYELTADFTAATGISGIRIYVSDESGEETVYGGYDEESETMATSVSFSSDVTITKIQLYYTAEGEEYPAWHDVDLGDDGSISVKFDEEAPSAAFTVPDANDTGYYTENFDISLAVSDTLSGIKSVTYYFEYENDDGGTVTTDTVTLYPEDSENSEDSEESGDSEESAEESTESGEAGGSTEFEETEESAEETESTDVSSDENSEDNIEESLTLTIPVDVSEYESNNFKVYVTVTDLAYNTDTVSTTSLKTASTDPVMTVEVTGTDEDGNTITDFTDYYGKRTITVTVTDRAAVAAEYVTLSYEASNTGSDYSTPGANISLSDEDGDGTYTGSVTISGDAVYSGVSLSYTNIAGLSASASVADFTVDQTDPTGSITVSDNLWEELLETLTFGIARMSNNSYTVEISANDYTSGVKSIEYYLYTQSDFEEAPSALTAETLDEKEFTTYSEAFEVSADQQFVVYARITDNAGRVIYISSDGYVVDTDGLSVTATAYAASLLDIEEDEDGNETVSAKEEGTGDALSAETDEEGNTTYSSSEIYDEDVYLYYSISDYGENGSYSGLASVTYTIKDQTETESGTLYEYEESDSPSYSDLVYETDGWIKVDSGTFNSSDVVVTITAEDNAGNEITQTINLDIDASAPEISVSYDNNDAENEKYFNAVRTATIVITERTDHFDEDAATDGITITAVDKDGNTVEDAYEISGWETAKGDTADSATHTATITYSADANYTFAISYTDEAGNENKEVDTGKSTAPYEFTIDLTDPTGTVTIEESSWSKFIEALTFGLYSSDTVEISAEYDDNLALYSVQYYLYSQQGGTFEYDSDGNLKSLTADELEEKELTDWTGTITVSADDQFVLYLKLTDYAGRVTWVSSDGYIVDTQKSAITWDIPSANENGTYNNDVTIGYTINDVGDEGSYSGIASITWTVAADGTVTQTETIDLTATDYDELVYEYKDEITVDSTLNNSGSVVVTIETTDNAGFTVTESINLDIDVTAPEISVSYDNNDAENEKYFDAQRTATIVITERTDHFDEDAATEGIEITATDKNGNAVKDAYTISEWETAEGDTADSATHTATVYFCAEADYTFAVSYTDKADNENKEVDTGESTAPYEFTIDLTDPTGSVTVGGSTWSELLSALTFGLYSQSSVQVKADTDDNLSPYTVEYYVYNEDEFTYDSNGQLHVFTKEELDSVTFAAYEDYTYEGDDQFVIYLKITDYAGNYIYISSDGYIIDSRSSEIEYEIVTAANENDIYSQDVVINYSVNDEDSNGSYSGIKTVSWQVTSEGEVTQSGSYDYSVSDPSYTELVEYMEDSITVSSSLNNTSDVVVTIETEDYAGNTASVSIPLDIDITAPEIEVSYDNNDAANEKYFDAERTAAIVITKRTDHFDSDNVVITITAEDAYGNTIDVSYLTEDLVWTTTEDSSDVNAAVHETSITFSEDANYTFAVSYTDDAGWDNEDVDTGESVAPYEFTVDKTAPTGSVTAANYEGGSSTWTVLRTSLTYGFYSKRSITVTGTSDDATSPVYSVEYYKVVSEDASDNTTPLTESELDAVTSWADFTSLTVSSDQQFTVYLKITDYAGNYTYISTNGLIVDENAPVETITPEITISPAQPVNDIYSGDVDVEITVTDPLNGGTYSGISVITYEILNMGTVTQSGTLYTFTTDDPSQSSLKQTWTGTITVDADLNNSNDVEIVVYASDNAGNSSDASESIQIDVTDPEISVSYDNNSADSSTYFNANRTATITITERNFDSDDVEIEITNTDGTIPQVSSWTKHSGSGNGDDTCWTATITYSADGDYTFDISYTDEAGNKASAADYGSSVAPTEFTIDKTDPTISVSYDNDNVSNELYFNASRTMTITIVEHNFDASRVTITMTSSGDGTDPGTPSYSWTSSGDTHTATLVFDDDGTYTFDIEMTDMAGNSNDGVSYGSSAASQEFTIDTTRYTDDGSLVITGVENGVAYKDKVIPAISFDDVNYQSGSLEITLLRTRKDEIDVDVTDEFITGNYTETSRGVDAEFDVFEEIQDNDGIYTLSIYYLDLAGNEVEESVTFTVNRFGSVYVYGDYLIGLIADGGAYVQDVEEGLVITEYNPDRLVEGSLNISITLDGKPLELDEDDYTVTPVINDTVATGSSGWYQYEYVIDADVFEEDGVYKMTISSEDATGNNPQSTNSDYDEIIFRVDTTAPEITSITGLDESIVNAEELTVEFVVYDTIALESVAVYVDGELCPDYPVTDFDDLNNYEGTFTLSESASAQEIEIVVVDKAGNVTSTSDEGFAEAAAYTFNKTITVSSKFFVRFYANKPLFWGTIIGIIVVIGIIIFLILFKKRKKEDEEIEQASEKRNAGKDTGSLKKDTKEIDK